MFAMNALRGIPVAGEVSPELWYVTVESSDGRSSSLLNVLNWPAVDIYRIYADIANIGSDDCAESAPGIERKSSGILLSKLEWVC